MPRQRQPAVYILCNRRNGTLYIGVTANLIARIWTHRAKVIDGFTKRYAVVQLVYYEQHSTVLDAIRREKQLKFFRRAEKIALIEAKNPTWRDLYPELLDAPSPVLDAQR